jgi:ankyrin repeat protein
MPTDERFTALHFSTYHGNIDLIRMMTEEMGADFSIKNVYGANVLHVAAQGDQPCPLYYFVQLKDMDINTADNRGSTPLHWACYSKAEFALSYILAMAPDLEITDQNGLTPLHLAVKAVPDL